MTSLVLASASPQRKTLLEGLGLQFDVVVSGVDEQACKESDPAKRALVLAELKARDVATKRKDSWILGCDTLVVSSKGELLEKPADADEARRMITLQSGAVSVVHSGLALVSPQGKEYSGLSSSKVRFRKMSVADIEWWVSTGMWKDRSGAFQIDSLGQLMIQEITGDFTGIVGLPVYLLGDLMRTAEAPFL